jgi:uncharacterized protein YkwD
MVRWMTKAGVCLVFTRFAVGALLLSASTARGQSVEHRDFDTLHIEAGGVHQEGVDRAAAVEQIVEKSNRFRREHDRATVTVENELAATAQEFAEYMARTDRYGHQADGRTPAERVLAHEYEFCLVAENIAMRYNSAGYETDALADGLVKGWIDSPEHRKNMLDPDVIEIGVGLAMSEKSGRYYAVQMFGRPKSAVIEVAISNRTRIEVEYQLGEQEFSLPAQVMRTHGRCRPPRLTLQFPEQEPQTVEVQRSGHYEVRQRGDGKLELSQAAR